MRHLNKHAMIMHFVFVFWLFHQNREYKVMSFLPLGQAKYVLHILECDDSFLQLVNRLI